MSKRIAVVGAGIGGLTLAIDLQRKGMDVQIYEQTSVLREVGAAVALSANATRFYEGRFGMAEQLGEKWAEVDGLIFRDGLTGEQIARLSSRDEYRRRYGAPYAGIHRADLQAVLFGALDTTSLHLSKRLTGIDDTGTAARLTFEDGDDAEADLVIGADGAKSLTRRLLLGYDDARYSGCTAARGIVAPELMPSLPDPGAIQFWMGPGGHLLHYPIGNGDQNFFLVKRESMPWAEKEWVVPAQDGRHIEPFAHWAPAVVEMISAVPVREQWALVYRPPLTHWSDGRVTLLGDAAHATVPHHGQGANQSIEDAIVLSDLLSETTDWDRARTEYEQRRRYRTRKVTDAAVTTGEVLHLPDGKRAQERNARLADADAFDRHLDWIHSFRADEEVPETRVIGS
ncbi:NAD(P)-binding protein [Gordonia sp. SID5947]|uniref:FAD-dependent monooxygenase n=1 Tax=Gordonia sp. SID5947 TaxID=2690315 RepID=UPI00136D2B0A|nr:FAD-dependent monooxygenase [Gordonia sp. SID5947]MYR05513.1 NAD(P)-binding protein [Gordonia sp. SID5947]